MSFCGDRGCLRDPWIFLGRGSRSSRSLHASAGKIGAADASLCCAMVRYREGSPFHVVNFIRSVHPPMKTQSKHRVAPTSRTSHALRSQNARPSRQLTSSAPKSAERASSRILLTGLPFKRPVHACFMHNALQTLGIGRGMRGLRLVSDTLSRSSS